MKFDIYDIFIVIHFYIFFSNIISNIIFIKQKSLFKKSLKILFELYLE
uniref:Uncharacterized protein n=1 Tax=viral metagenome TaxID=1070528 RepID=A0A6C0DL47_9ZZZZ